MPFNTALNFGDTRDWYAIVATNPTQRWASARGIYVTTADASWLTWDAIAGNDAANFDTEAELYEQIAVFAAGCARDRYGEINDAAAPLWDAAEPLPLTVRITAGSPTVKFLPQANLPISPGLGAVHVVHNATLVDCIIRDFLDTYNVGVVNANGASEFILGDNSTVGGVWDTYHKAASSPVDAGSLTDGTVAEARLTLLVPPQGRLTLVSGTPRMLTSQSAKTTIYYTPYSGRFLPSYNGTIMFGRDLTGTGERSIGLDSDAGHTGYHQSGKLFDVFFDDAGSRLVTGPAWTSDIARADALAYMNGFLTNAASMVAKFDTSASTATIAANRGLYLGTFRASANGQTEYVFGSSAAGGGESRLCLWNMYNRLDLATYVQDSTGNWTWTSATATALNVGVGSGLGNRVSFVCGLAEDAIFAEMSAAVKVTGGAGPGFGYVGFALDVTNALHRTLGVYGIAGTINFNYGAVGGWLSPQIGWHFVQAIQMGDGTQTAQTFGNNAAYGLQAKLKM